MNEGSCPLSPSLPDSYPLSLPDSCRSSRACRVTADCGTVAAAAGRGPWEPRPVEPKSTGIDMVRCVCVCVCVRARARARARVRACVVFVCERARLKAMGSECLC